MSKKSSRGEGLADVLEIGNLLEKCRRKNQEVLRAQGSLDALLEQLMGGFGCSTLQEGLNTLLAIQKKQEAIKEDIEEAQRVFIQKYGSFLEG